MSEGIEDTVDRSGTESEESRARIACLRRGGRLIENTVSHRTIRLGTYVKLEDGEIDEGFLY